MLLRKMQAMKTATEENKQKKNILHQKMDWTLNKHLEQIYFCPFLAIGGESSVKQLLWMTIMHDLDAFLSSHHNKVMPHGNARQCVNTKGGHWIKLDKKKKKYIKWKQIVTYLVRVTCQDIKFKVNNATMRPQFLQGILTQFLGSVRPLPLPFFFDW